jgi:hypothetical protein
MLETMVHVVHVPCCSTCEGRMADRLSRKDTLNDGDKELLTIFEFAVLPSEFTDLLLAPKEDWGLPLNLCNSVDNILNS